MMGVTDLQKACMWRPQIGLSGKSGGDGPATTFSGCKESSPGAYFEIDEIERGMVTYGRYLSCYWIHVSKMAAVGED